MGTVMINPEQLREAVLGNVPAVPRAKAFALVAASGNVEREALLAGVMENAAETVHIRSAAATALGRVATPQAEDILIRNLRVIEPAITYDVLKALARIGGPAARNAIESTQFPGGELQQTALFAARLISYRHRLPGYEWPQPDEREMLRQPGEAARRLRVFDAERGQVDRILDDLSREPLAASLSRERVIGVDCGPVSNAVVVNREFTAEDAVENLMREKALFGAVAMQSRETGTYYVSYVILTTPAHGGIGILMARPSGTLVLAGSGLTAGSAVSFSIRAVLRPGASPTYVEGAFQKGSLHLRTALVSDERVPRKTPLR